VVVKPSIEQFLLGHSNAFWSNLLDLAYPRWQVEQKRFPPAFFLQLADQVFTRFIVWASFFAFILISIRTQYQFKKRWIRFFTGTMDSESFLGMNAIFYFLIAYLSADMLPELLKLSKWTELYEPISFLGVFGIPFPYVPLLWLYGASLTLLCLLLALGFRNSLAYVYVAVLFIVLEGLHFSFGKIDHQYATVHYALLLWPLMVFFKHSDTSYPRWPAILIRMAIVLGYGFSGVEKLMLHGLAWPMEVFCPYAKTLASGFLWNNWNCILLGGSLLLFQCTFPVVIWIPKLLWVYLPAGILFHSSVYFFTGIGGVLHPWWLLFLFFFNWRSVGISVRDFQLWLYKRQMLP
jgi:hypothetical protein